MNYVPTLEEILRDFRYRMHYLAKPKFMEMRFLICEVLGDRKPKWISCD